MKRKIIFFQDFEISTTIGRFFFSTACPVGKKALGCHIEPSFVSPQTEKWRQSYPSEDGTICKCYDFFGAR